MAANSAFLLFPSCHVFLPFPVPCTAIQCCRPAGIADEIAPGRRISALRHLSKWSQKHFPGQRFVVNTYGKCHQRVWGAVSPSSLPNGTKNRNRVIRIRQANLALSKFLLLRITNRKELSPPNNHKKMDCQESKKLGKGRN